jgi:hypothetical protein
MRQGPSKRPRGRNGRKQNIPTRHQTLESSGPEVRIRGNAYQVHEKYLALARDATSSGDRIAAENYYQHAEHYFRIINASTDPRSPAPAQDAAVDDPRGDGYLPPSTAPGNGAKGGSDMPSVDGGDATKAAPGVSPFDGGEGEKRDSDIRRPFPASPLRGVGNLPP